MFVMLAFALKCNLAETIKMIIPANINAVRRGIMSDLFGSDINSLDDVESIDNIRLPRLAPTKLPSKKLTSLAQKYFSIPPEFLSYFPVPPADILAKHYDVVTDAPETRSNVILKKTRVKKKQVIGVEKPKSRGVGRPKNPVTIPQGQPTLFSFFTKK